MSEGKNLMNEIAQDDLGGQTDNTGNQPAEKFLPQTQVNALIGSAKQKMYEKGRQDALAEASQQQNIQPQQQQQMIPQQNSGATMSVQGDDVRRIAQEEFAKQQQEWQKQVIAEQNKQQANQAAQQIMMKFNEAKTRIPDFDKVVDMNTAIQMPDVLGLANQVDNTADVMYDLMQNPGKIAQIRGVPEPLARLQIKRLSDSIKQNQMAASQPNTPEPLDQVKPSNIGLGNGSKQSVSEMRNNPSYRG